MNGDGKRSHGVIDGLPEKIKDEVKFRLINNEPYRDITGWLNDKGVEVSKSSVQRYGAKYLRAFERLQRAKEFARIIAEDGVDRPATELHEAANALAVEGLFDIILDNGAEPEDKLKAARLLPQLQQAQTQTERVKILAREKGGEIRAAMNLLKAEVFESISSEHPEVVEIIMSIADGIADKVNS